MIDNYLVYLILHLEEFSIKKCQFEFFLKEKYREQAFLLKICILDTNFTHFNREIHSN